MAGKSIWTQLLSKEPNKQSDTATHCENNHQFFFPDWFLSGQNLGENKRTLPTQPCSCYRIWIALNKGITIWRHTNRNQYQLLVQIRLSRTPHEFIIFNINEHAELASRRCWWITPNTGQRRSRTRSVANFGPASQSAESASTKRSTHKWAVQA